MAYVAPNLRTIQDKLRKYFELAGFENIEPGTPEHALYNMMADNLYELYNALQSNYTNVLPLNAEGATLDLWASFFNISRGSSVYSEDSSLTNVHFLATESNRQIINEGNELTIPAGTVVSVGGIRRFVTLNDAILPAYGSPPYIAYTGVRSEQVGAYSNVDVGELSDHNLGELTSLEGTVGLDLVEVNNKFAITSGSFQQLDNDLQLDIQNVFGKQITTNLESLLSKVLSLGGVSDVNILEASRGTGTFSVFIDSTAPIVSINLMEQVQALIDIEKPIGTIGYVEYPEYKAITVKFEILPKSGTTGDEVISDLSGTETNNMISLINNIDRGDPFDPGVLLRIVLDNENVNNAMIKELKIGTYSLIEDKVLNSEFTVAGGAKELEWNQKWFISSSLISYCTVENG